MNASVIIPTLNGERSLRPLLYALHEQTLPPAEIIIIDSSSDDQTIEIARELQCKIITIDRNEFDHGGTRNHGVSNAAGEIVVFMTQDAVPADDRLLERLIEPLSGNRSAASFARQIALPEAAPPERFARLFNYPDAPSLKGIEDLPLLGIKAFFFSDVCSAVRRTAYQEVGGFPERAIMNEDMILAAKLILDGHKIAYCPDARVLHSHNYGVRQYFRRYFDIGTSLNMNNWILQHGKAEGEGVRFVKEQTKYLMDNHCWHWIPYSMLLSASKYTGYKLGLSQDRIPARLKYLLSLNKTFWTKGASDGSDQSLV